MSITQDIRNAFSRRDNAVVQYIIVNVLVFAVLVVIRAVLFVARGPNDPAVENVMRQVQLSSDLDVLLRHPWTVLTYAFIHDVSNPFHILLNMLNLYWFGRIIQEYLGSRRFVSLYLLGALAGAALFVLSYHALPVFASHIGQPLIGASAAVVAVMVAAATLLPDYTFMLFLFGAVRIKYIALFVILVMSVAPIFSGNPGGGLAHLGGALLGYVFIKQMQAGRDLGAPLHAIGDWVSRLFERRPTMQVTHRAGGNRGTGSPYGAGTSAPARPAKPATPPAEDVDAILDKISRSGYESLSKEEKQRLFKASQQ